MRAFLNTCLNVVGSGTNSEPMTLIDVVPSGFLNLKTSSWLSCRKYRRQARSITDKYPRADVPSISEKLQSLKNRSTDASGSCVTAKWGNTAKSYSSPGATETGPSPYRRTRHSGSADNRKYELSTATSGMSNTTYFAA